MHAWLLFSVERYLKIQVIKKKKLSQTRKNYLTARSLAAYLLKNPIAMAACFFSASTQNTKNKEKDNILLL